jgi:hypothetical protein
MSPTVLRAAGFRFYFFSREEAQLHIHVSSAHGEAKFWLEPKLELAENYGIKRRQLRKIENLLEEHKDEIVDAWKKHFDR